MNYLFYLLFDGKDSRRFIGFVFGGALGLAGGMSVLGIELVVAVVVLIGVLFGVVLDLNVIIPVVPSARFV